MTLSKGSDAPIFIVGCPRSGTGLVRDVLRSHSRLTFPPESHFIVRLYREYGDPRTRAEALILADTILRLSWIKRWKLGLTRHAFADCRSFRQVTSLLFQTWAQREGKGRWGDKTPQYIFAIPTLLEIFPAGKIIHCYRDGRDVALSSLPDWFAPKSIYAAAYWWRRFVEAGRAAGKVLSNEQYLEVSYESILTKPMETMNKVCRYLGEPDFAGELRPDILERVSPAPILGVRRKPVISKSTIVTSNCEKWRREMSTRDRVVFESIAGDLLSTLGYELEGRARRLAILERTYWEIHAVLTFGFARLNTRNLPARLANELLFLRARTSRRRLLGRDQLQ